MNKIVFDEIHKEVLSEIEPLVYQALKVYARNFAQNTYPEKITVPEILDIIFEFNIYAAKTIISEAVRAATLTIQKYHERL